ncbi:hypothetical protein QBC35DRAFT_471387 [Podospora australis]|uniref:Uncharacterized protein n=1 Tax=Podospora australis TaxID=1536484 RepID=A0AAN6X3I4_9PEZI|nr:hypothetical protein QBC35DRAFT_471387 [Podospora australis]
MEGSFQRTLAQAGTTEKEVRGTLGGFLLGMEQSCDDIVALGPKVPLKRQCEAILALLNQRVCPPAERLRGVMAGVRLESRRAATINRSFFTPKNSSPTAAATGFSLTDIPANDEEENNLLLPDYSSSVCSSPAEEDDKGNVYVVEEDIPPLELPPPELDYEGQENKRKEKGKENEEYGRVISSSEGESRTGTRTGAGVLVAPPFTTPSPCPPFTSSTPTTTAATSLTTTPFSNSSVVALEEGQAENLAAAAPKPTSAAADPKKENEGVDHKKDKNIGFVDTIGVQYDDVKEVEVKKEESKEVEKTKTKTKKRTKVKNWLRKKVTSLHHPKKTAGGGSSKGRR